MKVIDNNQRRRCWMGTSAWIIIMQKSGLGKLNARDSISCSVALRLEESSPSRADAITTVKGSK